MTAAIVCLWVQLIPERALAWNLYEDVGGLPSCVLVQDYENGSIRIGYTKGSGPFYVMLNESDWLFREGQKIDVNLRVDDGINFGMKFQAAGNSDIKTVIEQSKYIFFKAFNYFAGDSILRISFPESNEDVRAVPFSDSYGAIDKFRICVVLN